MIAFRHAEIQTVAEDISALVAAADNGFPTQLAGLVFPSALMEVMKPKHEFNEMIVIPQEARGRLLSSFSTSVRLAHVFQFKGFRLVGELHGLRYYWSWDSRSVPTAQFLWCTRSMTVIRPTIVSTPRTIVACANCSSEPTSSMWPIACWPPWKTFAASMATEAVSSV
jgi:hypothetical protein